jgi:hypothetical protein
VRAKLNCRNKSQFLNCIKGAQHGGNVYRVAINHGDNNGHSHSKNTILSIQRNPFYKSTRITEPEFDNPIVLNSAEDRELFWLDRRGDEPRVRDELIVVINGAQ